MNSFDETNGPGIGATLKDARRRLGMDIKEAEERTKIRTKYLRALEAEDWEVLPAPAYVRGFLRVYGGILGLDGEMLADRYRRGYEEPTAIASAASEPVLSNQRARESRSPSRGGWIVAVLVVIVALLVVLGLTAGDDGGDDQGSARVNAGSKGDGKGSDGRGNANDGKDEGATLEPIDLEIEPLGTVQVCLVGDSGDPLIDSQVLTTGASEAFSGERTYRLDLRGGGSLRLQAGGEEQKLEASDDASFEASQKGITEVSYAGPDCP